jgi:hypothetical protein
MTLYFLDYVFLLHLTLKAPECVFEGLSLLQPDFCQRNDTPKPVLGGQTIYCKVRGLSQGLQCGERGQDGAGWAAHSHFSGSKSHFQCQLDLARREGIEGLHGVGGNLKVPGEVIDSNLVTDFYEVSGVAGQAVFGDGDEFVVAIQ